MAELWRVFWPTIIIILAFGFNSGTSQENDSQDVMSQMVQMINSMNSTLAQMNDKFEKLENESSKITSVVSKMDLKLEEDADVRKLQIEEISRPMISNPVAKLFSEENFTGDAEDYNFQDSSFRGGCHKLEKLPWKVKSVDSLGSCTRLFYGGDCSGGSLAIYPGSPNSHNVLNENFTGVGSIGPCLQDEFEHGYLTGTENKDLRKHSINIRQSVPDFVEFYSYRKYNESTTVKDPETSLIRYKLGPNDRLEFVSAEVHPRHLSTSEPDSNAGNMDPQIKGLAIPVSIGGPADKSYNVFPQSHSAREKLMGLAGKIRIFLENQADKWVSFSLNFMYEDDKETSPYVFYYFMSYDKEEIEYGRIVNY